MTLHGQTSVVLVDAVDSARAISSCLRALLASGGEPGSESKPGDCSMFAPPSLPEQRMTTMEMTSTNVFTQSPLVFTGRLTDVLPVGMSLGEPPFFHALVRVTPVAVLRGTTVPQESPLFRMVEDTDEFPAVNDQVWLMAATKLDESWGVTTWTLSALVPAEDSSLAL